MCKNLLPGIQTAYSYGIGWEDNWGCDVSAAHKGARCISTTVFLRSRFSARAASFN
jgi:hypothetical protein